MAHFDREGSRGGLAVLSVVLSQISISIGASLGKSLFRQLSPEILSALRTTFASAILILATRPWPLRFSSYVLLYGLVLGAMNILIYLAFQRLPIGIAVSIEICGPLAVVVLNSRTAQDFLWLSLAVAGLCILLPLPPGPGQLDRFGFILAGGAALCWAFYIMLGRRAILVGARQAVTMGMLVASLVTVPVALYSGLPDHLTPRQLGLGLAIATLSSALPYFLEMHALQVLSERVFAMAASASPATSAIVASFLLGETLTSRQWFSIAAIGAAAAGASWRRTKRLARFGVVGSASSRSRDSGADGAHD